MQTDAESAKPWTAPVGGVDKHVFEDNRPKRVFDDEHVFADK